MNTFHWIALFCIFFAGLAGGYYPFVKHAQARTKEGFPGGQAFASGVFLALSLVIMLPSGTHLFEQAFPGTDYPFSATVAIAAFLVLLALEHVMAHLRAREGIEDEGISGPVLPVIMIVMIAIPSFFLGTALGLSGTTAAVFIFIAIIVHKGSAGFGLALNLVRSTISRGRAIMIYSFFLFSTPVGILVGSDVHEFLSGSEMVIVKAFILSMASGVFLYMGTLHGLRHTPLVENCNCKRNFLLMLLGLVITALVRLALGEAHGG
ncbi:ZIP family metal transporter [Candidatus Omnitrophota bacterium]